MTRSKLSWTKLTPSPIQGRDMKKFTVTMGGDPSSSSEVIALERLLTGVSAIFMALSLKCSLPSVPQGLEEIVQGDKHWRLAKEVMNCNRMVAFVTFHQMGPWAEIAFSEEKKLVLKMTISYCIQTQRFLVIGKV